MKTILMVQREIVFKKRGSSKREWERVDTCPNSLFSFPLLQYLLSGFEISPSLHTPPPLNDQLPKILFSVLV